MGNTAVVARPRVTEVEARVIDNDVADYDVDGNEIMRWWAYVWPSSNGRGQVPRCRWPV